MSDETSGNTAGMPEDDRHAEAPIAGMNELEQETSASFLAGVRKKVYRRQAVSQLVSFSWQLPKTVFVELGSMLVHILNTFSTRKGE
ncbi:MAG TPA: hypothetical protein VN737_16480 [Bryobacteraceae bacterium]|jgi:hypothetical protein|nr:hypothetical protein [Bryobacteraceae bacterium]